VRHLRISAELWQFWAGAFSPITRKHQPITAGKLWDPFGVCESSMAELDDVPNLDSLSGECQKLLESFDKRFAEILVEKQLHAGPAVLHYAAKGS
jgi:hypothetical protein